MSILDVMDLRVYYHTMKGVVRAVDDISFGMERGDILSIVGESGCGKTTTANTILKILPPEAIVENGNIIFDGTDILDLDEDDMKRVRWRKISMVFQNAMNALNPVKTVGDQIIDAMKTHLNISESEARSRVKELFEMVGLDPDRIKNYPHEFSGGMRQRVFIAMALSCDPNILIADEPTTGLDVIVQRNILELLRELRDRLGLSILLITHDLAAVAHVCDKVCIMYAGKIVEYGSVDRIYSRPRHPYTYMLIKSFPKIGSSKERLVTIPGSPPSLINPPKGCRFHPRCPYATERCAIRDPEVMSLEDGFVSCHLADELELVM
jgi:peptide/nickel transport system ATP-binding protein